MKKKIKEFIKKVLNLFLKNYILFESIPDLSDNTKAVFDELIARGVNQKYKCIWIVSDKNKNFPKIKNVRYIDNKTNKWLFRYYRYSAKCLICCNYFCTSVLKNQTSFYLCHGTAIKSVRNYYNVPEKIDYVTVSSEQSKEMMAYELRGEVGKFYGLGFPRNDVFSKPEKDLSGMLGEYKKIIVWYPTFRNHKSGNKNVSSKALPILHDLDKAKELNEVASKNDVLIVLKPHFAQDVSYIKDYNLSNIKFIDDEFFEDNNITSYEFLNSCDSLITDYSSVYYDYLLTDKPVAVIWEDIEEYRKNQGFAVDVDYYMKGAEKIYNIEDFKDFVENIACEHDGLKNERKEICEWANYSNDGQNSKRVADFIIEKANLKI